MARGALINAITDLQIEWATSYAHHSVRDFLISKKGFKDWQYRFVMRRAPLMDWKGRREEIQNRIAATSIEVFIVEAAKTTQQYVLASKLAAAKAITLMSSAEPLSPKDLLNCANALASSQTVFHRAMGIEHGNAAPIRYELPPDASSDPTPPPTTNGPPPCDMTKLKYEEIQRLITMKKEVEQIYREAAAREPAENDPWLNDPADSSI